MLRRKGHRALPIEAEIPEKSKWGGEVLAMQFVSLNTHTCAIPLGVPTPDESILLPFKFNHLLSHRRLWLSLKNHISPHLSPSVCTCLQSAKDCNKAIKSQYRTVTSLQLRSQKMKEQQTPKQHQSFAQI